MRNGSPDPAQVANTEACKGNARRAVGSDGVRGKPRQSLINHHGYSLVEVSLIEEVLELPQQIRDGSTVPDQRGAECSAFDARNASVDPHLVAVVEACGSLPEPIKAGLLAMIHATG